MLSDNRSSDPQDLESLSSILWELWVVEFAKMRFSVGNWQQDLFLTEFFPRNLWITITVVTWGPQQFPLKFSETFWRRSQILVVDFLRIWSQYDQFSWSYGWLNLKNRGFQQEIGSKTGSKTFLLYWILWNSIVFFENGNFFVIC